MFERTSRECLLRYLLQQNARLVNRMNPLTNIFVSYCDGMVMVMGFRSSELFGQCNSCDGKLKGCNSCVDQQSVASWTFQKPETMTFFKIIDKAKKRLHTYVRSSPNLLMQCESGDASIPPSRELEALPLSDSAGQKGNRSLSAAGGQRPPTSSQMALACGTINLATSQTSRKQLASWQKGQGQWYCGTNHCDPCQILRSYFLRFGDAPSKYQNTRFIYIYTCTYKCVYIYIYVHISRIMGGFSMKIPKGTCAASLSQDSRGTSTSLSHLAGQIDDRRFSCGHYTICCF